MLFQQTAAPTGWTKQTTHNNKALRVVTGTASFGGSTAFTTVFSSRTPSGTVSVSGSNSGGSVSNRTLTIAQMPSHSHVMSPVKVDASGSSLSTQYSFGYTSTSQSTNSTGGGGAHNNGFTNPAWSGSASFSGNSLDFAVQYVDLIIASKD